MVKNKVILILVDGMASQSLQACRNPFAIEFQAAGIGNVYAKTVVPSVTLLCHMSLILTEQGKKCAMFYSWEELRDISRPGTMQYSEFFANSNVPNYDMKLTSDCLVYITEQSPDFVFLYLGLTDAVGHEHGWMSKPFLQAVYNAWDCIHTVYKQFFKDYCIFVTADHGGHDYSHGLDLDDDINIPILVIGIEPKAILPEQVANANIMDIAPTVTTVFQIKGDPDRKGVSFVSR